MNPSASFEPFQIIETFTARVAEDGTLYFERNTTSQTVLIPETWKTDKFFERFVFKGGVWLGIGFNKFGIVVSSICLLIVKTFLIYTFTDHLRRSTICFITMHSQTWNDRER